MLDTMSSREYQDWIEYFNTEPFPNERADIRTAETIQAILGAAGVQKIPSVEEILPDWWGERVSRKQSPAQIQARMGLVTAMIDSHRKQKDKHK